MIKFKCLPNADGPYASFSNYILSPFKYVVPMGSQKGTEIQCEHANKALHCTKASFFEDKANFDEIQSEPDPGRCQQLGRNCKGFADDAWLPVVEDVAFEVLRQKFGANPDLADLLVSTGDAHIVNANNNPLWGIGKDKDGQNFAVTLGVMPEKWSAEWQGQNIQGKALMRVRDSLIAERADNKNSRWLEITRENTRKLMKLEKPREC